MPKKRKKRLKYSRRKTKPKKRKKLSKVRKNRKPRKVKKRKKSKRKVKSKKRLSFKIPSQTKDADGNTIIKVSESWANHAYVNDSKYKKKYKLSIKENEKFWAKEGKRITWMKKYTKIKVI